MKILVVDDNREIRNLIKEIIIDCVGATILMGVNGQDGWREFQESQPDMVITDCRMETREAGLELARKIKAVSPGTPVIMITAEQINQEAAVDCFLPKPFNLKTLVETIKTFRKEVKTMEKREEGMVRVRAWTKQKGEFFDYVKRSHLDRLIKEGYVKTIIEENKKKEG